MRRFAAAVSSEPEQDIGQCSFPKYKTKWNYCLQSNCCASKKKQVQSQTDNSQDRGGSRGRGLGRSPTPKPAKVTLFTIILYNS